MALCYLPLAIDVFLFIRISDLWPYSFPNDDRSSTCAQSSSPHPDAKGALSSSFILLNLFIKNRLFSFFLFLYEEFARRERSAFAE